VQKKGLHLMLGHVAVCVLKLCRLVLW